MAEPFISLSADERREVLELAAEATGRAAHLLEKDVWVVWTLSALFSSSLGPILTFKGGTSLSKAYRVIDRFSEDIDLTCDIRTLLPDLVQNPEGMPDTRSQARRWTDAVRHRLPQWIEREVIPVIRQALAKDGLQATVGVDGEGQDKVFINYDPLKRGNGYVAPHVLLEFGARSTGEPNELREVASDMEGHVGGVVFPTASPRVMRVERTFWEKATAAHVYCAQGKLRGERYARHWHDLVALMRSEFFQSALDDGGIAEAVAAHKSLLFPEKATDGTAISYEAAARGQLQIVPKGESRAALKDDYARMIEDAVLIANAAGFDELMSHCAELQEQVNARRP